MKLFSIPTSGVLLLLGAVAFASAFWIDEQTFVSDPDTQVSSKARKPDTVVQRKVHDGVVHAEKLSDRAPVERLVRSLKERLRPIFVRSSNEDCSTSGDQRKAWWLRVPDIADCIRTNHGHSLRAAARFSGVSEDLLVAIIIKESEGDPKKVSSTGCCVGLMQIDRGATAREFGINPERLLDSHENILGGAKVLAHYQRRSGSLETGLMWYYAGPNGKSDKAPDYVLRVKKILAVI